jgi:phage minor structural protein
VADMMPEINDYPWVLDDDGNLSVILDQAYNVIIDYQMITDTNGQEILNFNIPLDDPKAEEFGNEDVLQVGGSEFTIRTVTDGWDDNGEQCFQIYAEARWYELAEYDPIQPFSFTNVSPDMVMDKFLSTTDWTKGTIDIIATSDFSITELTNPLAGIRMLPTLFGGELYFDNINKKVHLLQRIGMDTDLLYAYSKNLKKNQRVIDTRYLVTRFRPIGKDGLTIADVNNGVDYLENYQWFDAIGKKRKVKCESLSNDNITDPTALKEWGQGIVDANSIPRITYYMDVVLDKNDGIPGMGDTVRVYDSLLKMNLPSRVAQRSYNVLQPWLSTMQLSTALYTLSDQLNNSVSGMTQKINYLNTETATVKQEVINAQATADGKNTVFYGSAEPSASVAKENDLWYQYVNGTLSRMYRFDGVQWQMISSIIPGDAVIGGTIDFANVTALNIDAGSISTGILNAININGSIITGSTLRTANGSNYVHIDDQYVRLMENDIQRGFLGYYINTRGQLQPTLLLGQNADNTTIPDGTFCISQVDNNGSNGFIGVKAGQESDQSPHYPANVEMDSNGNATMNADTQVTFNSNAIRLDAKNGLDIIAEGDKLYLQGVGGTVNNHQYFNVFIDDAFVTEFQRSPVGGAEILLPYCRMVNDTGQNGYFQILNGDRTGFWGIAASEFKTVSKREYKTNIAEIDFKALDEVMQVNILQYNLISDIQSSLTTDPRTCYGMIADDLSTPECFVGKEREGVDLYSTLSLVLKSIQELKKEKDIEFQNKDNEIQDLVIKVANLEARLAELEQKIG